MSSSSSSTFVSCTSLLEWTSSSVTDQLQNVAVEASNAEEPNTGRSGFILMDHNRAIMIPAVASAMWRSKSAWQGRSLPKSKGRTTSRGRPHRSADSKCLWGSQCSSRQKCSTTPLRRGQLVHRVRKDVGFRRCSVSRQRSSPGDFLHALP